MRRSLLLVVVLALALVPSAHAVEPVVLGDGRAAGVTLDAAGNAYIAWIGHGADPTPLFFCRLPLGAGTCDINKQLTVPGTSLTRPYVVVDGVNVHVLSYRYGVDASPPQAVYRLTSQDGGTNFGPGTQIAAVNFHDAIRGPGANISMIADNSAVFQSVSLAATGASQTTADLAPDRPYSPTIAMLNANSILAVSVAGNSSAAFRRYIGTGDPNDANSWSAAVELSPHARYPRLAAGPAGVFLASDNAEGNLEVRRFRADFAGFDPPVAIPPPANEFSGGAFDLTQDPGGRLHLVWPQGDAAGSHVGYAVSDDGTAWRKGFFDVAADPADVSQVPGGMRLAIRSDHVGVVVWDNGTSGKVRALPIGPEPPPAPPPPTPADPAPVVQPPAPPTPELGKWVTGGRVKGTVLVKKPGESTYSPLDESEPIPVGSAIDVRKGRIRLTSASGVGAGATQTAEFYLGIFEVQQKARVSPTTDLVLTGGSFARCPKTRRARTSAARKVRRLWGSGKGRFRTRGRHAAATVRGTTWLVEDRCDGTLVKVKQGSVRVRDNKRKKTFTVKAPRQRLVRPRR